MEATCAASLDKLATGTRACCETKIGVSYSAVTGRAVCALPPSICPIYNTECTGLTRVRILARVVGGYTVHSAAVGGVTSTVAAAGRFNHALGLGSRSFGGVALVELPQDSAIVR